MMSDENPEHEPEHKAPSPPLSNHAYDVGKFIAQIALPALGTLYFALSTIWGLPYGEQVVGTITVVDVFLGALLGLSSKAYTDSGAKYDGELDIEEAPVPDGEGAVYKSHKLKLDLTPEELEKKKEIVFKVNPPSS